MNTTLRFRICNRPRDAALAGSKVVPRDRRGYITLLPRSGGNSFKVTNSKLEPRPVLFDVEIVRGAATEWRSLTIRLPRSLSGATPLHGCGDVSPSGAVPSPRLKRLCGKDRGELRLSRSSAVTLSTKIEYLAFDWDLGDHV